MNILKELHKKYCLSHTEIEKNKIEFNYRMYTFVINTENNKKILNDLVKTFNELVDNIYSEKREDEREEKKKNLTEIKKIFKENKYKITAIFGIIIVFIDMLLEKENKMNYK